MDKIRQQQELVLTTIKSALSHWNANPSLRTQYLSTADAFFESATMPSLVWKEPKTLGVSGSAFPRNKIVIRIGRECADVELRVAALHEMAHYLLPKLEDHSARFWDLAWYFYRQFKLPIMQRSL